MNEREECEENGEGKEERIKIAVTEKHTKKDRQTRQTDYLD